MHASEVSYLVEPIAPASSAWSAALSRPLAARALQVARDVAGRLRERCNIEAAAAAARRQSAYPRSIHWVPGALAQGDAGLALTCAYLDACCPGENWDRSGHACLSLAGAAPLTDMPEGLFAGLAGLAFAGWCLSRSATRYRRFLAAVDSALLPRVVAQAERLERSDVDGLAFFEFDVISGLSGVGVYLLCRREEAHARAALQAILRALKALTDATDRRPRWWTPARLMGNPDTARLYPYGNLNCGLAHGIPGPIALMALAVSEGIRVDGLENALERSVEWLIAHRADDAWGINWPAAVPLTASGDPQPPGSPWGACRAAWCYGSPGAARALWLAGVALDRAAWRSLAVEAMLAVCRRPRHVQAIDSPTFCHGLAGLLQITVRFAHDTAHPAFVEAATALTGSILSAYEPDSLLGFRNWEPGGIRVDQAGLLDGAPGVLLALLAAATDVEPGWDRAFLLS